MRPRDRTVEHKLAEIAGKAHGVVTREDLLRAGVSAAGIQRRVRKGLLIPQFRGTYRVGHAAPSPEAHYMAAVKACGPRSLLAGRAAGWLLGLLSGKPPAPEVLTPTERRIPGIRTRRRRRIDDRDGTTFKGIAVTTVPATIVDLAAELLLDQLARVCHEAGVRYRTTPAQVSAVLARRAPSRGVANLRLILRGDAPVTLSKLERAFLALLQQEGLPLPITNRPAGTRRVDCRWPEHGLTVELDGYRYHHSRHAWEQDRRRAREARARGDEFRRYTYGDVLEDPSYMLSELRALLASPRPA
ncbi:MAG: hypothetical protein QOI65_484 [Thermoleophilaceae bacterium]|nr:hypothetical protein [Thermoleophilaceae bacterium]